MSLSQKKEKSFFHEYEQIALLQSTYLYNIIRIKYRRIVCSTIDNIAHKTL